jgi:polysaccharide export outer membrane protein
MFRPAPVLAAALALALSAGGCARVPLTPEVFEAGPADLYRLASGDRLRILVFGQDNLSNAYAVDPAGRISFPLVGSIPAAGRTTAELAAAIEQRLRGGFLREPQVSVEVEQFRPFFVLGEVGQSGQYPFVPGATVQTAIAISGGFGPRAARSYAELTRSVDGRLVTANVPINFPLRPGDTIVVKERFF